MTLALTEPSTYYAAAANLMYLVHHVLDLIIALLVLSDYLYDLVLRLGSSESNSNCLLFRPKQ